MASDNSNLRRLTTDPLLDPTEALRASEERFRELIDNIKDVVWSIHFNKDPLHAPTTFVSAQSDEILGYSPSNFIEQSDLWSSRIHPEDWRKVVEATDQVILKKTAVTRYYRFRHGKTGEYRWLEDRLSPRYDGNQTLIGLFGVARDITDRKQSEIRELHRLQILEKIARGRPLKDVLLSLVHMIEDESPSALCSIHLLDESGRHLRHSTAPRLPDFYNQAIDGVEIGPNVGSCGQCAFTGRRVIIEDIHNHPNWALYRDLAERAGLRSCWSEPIQASNGSILGTFAIYHNHVQSPSPSELEAIGIAANLASIALERDRAESTLRQSEERFRIIFEKAAVGVAQLDVTKGRFARVNERYCRILGRSEAEVLDCNFIEVTHPDDREASAALLARMISGELREYSLEKRYLRPDGSIRWVNLNVSATWAEGANPNLNIAIVEDITERKLAEEDRRRLDAQLQHAQKLESLGVMAGGIAHDFNNLLTGILGYCDLALIQLPSGSESREHLQEAIHGARQAAELTKQLLAYSGKGRFVIEPINLSTLVDDMTRLLQISISKKCVLKLNLYDNLPAVEADATQIRQIVMNLVINASEAIGDRSGVICITTGTMHCDADYLKGTLDDQSLPEGNYTYLEVADTGCGMTKETLTRIFDPFFTTKFTGRGLGLSAVLGIVRGHRGTLKCYSEVGKGTTFKVLLPISERAFHSMQENRLGTHQWHGHGTIMIVDDEQAILGMTRLMLEAMGFSVITAENGQVALDLYRSTTEEIRLILLDMTMPRLDGEETFRELRRIRNDVRVILTSGYSEQSANDRFAGKGLAGFIQKPFRFEELRDTIRKVLES